MLGSSLTTQVHKSARMHAQHPWYYAARPAPTGHTPSALHGAHALGVHTLMQGEWALATCPSLCS
jgi:hypothetical protein